MKKCLIFLEEQYESFSVDLLKVAEEMYGASFVSTAVSVSADTEAAVGRFDEIIEVKDERVRSFDVRSIVDVMEELQKKNTYDSILISATHFGRMLAPRLAMRLKAGLVADVTQINRIDDRVEMVRPAFSGKIMAGIINVGKEPTMMSVRPGVFTYDGEANKDTKKITYTPEQVSVSGIRLVEQAAKPEITDIRESEVLVSGGGGILYDFDMLDELAVRLGGMKSASRKVVDSGKADRSIQVGQSGKVVHPKLYMAIGIYGALQHVAGLHKVKHLIAVNINRQAPICSLADIVVEGDAREFVQNLIEKIDHER